MCLCILTNVQNSAGPQIHSRLSFHLVDSRENLDETKDFKIFRAFPVFALQTASRIYHCKALQWPMHQLWQDMILDDEVQSLVLWYCRSVRWNRKKKQGRSEDALQVLDELKQVLIHFTAYINYICYSYVYIIIYVVYYCILRSMLILFYLHMLLWKAIDLDSRVPAHEASLRAQQIGSNDVVHLIFKVPATRRGHRWNFNEMK